MSESLQNRAQARKNGEKLASTSSRNWAMLVVGIFIGVIASEFYSGIRSGESNRLGSGLKQVFEVPRIEVREPEESVSESDPPRTDFEVFTVLPEPKEAVAASVMDLESEENSYDEISEREKLPAIGSAGYYMLQVSSYLEKTEADRVSTELSRIGFVPQIQKSRSQSDKRYRVQIGPFYNIKESEAVHSQLKGMGIKAILFKVSRP